MDSNYGAVPKFVTKKIQLIQINVCYVYNNCSWKNKTLKRFYSCQGYELFSIKLSLILNSLISMKIMHCL